MTTLLAVPNVSEGRDDAVVGRLAHAFAVQARLLDTHSDAVHNRSVFTIASERGDLVPALAGGAREAVATVDMTAHQGAHPCVGALDVCPVVWLEDGDREAAREQALSAAAEIAALEVPVFLYGDLASSAERRERGFFREGGLAALAARMRSGELRPDLGPEAPHPSAGATLVTARPPLAAFNVDLEGLTLEGARAIAAELRESGGGLPGVRAIGLDLGAGQAQVSTNVHDPVTTPLGQVVERVRELAPAGARIVAAEVVGLVPVAALAGFPEDVPLPGFERERGVIEERLRADH